MTLKLALSTCPPGQPAQTIAEELVSRRLAACVNIIPGLESIYRWQGRIEREPEVLLLIKTSDELLEQLETELLRLHPYETPEFVVLDTDRVAKGYLTWLLENVGG